MLKTSATLGCAGVLLLLLSFVPAWGTQPSSAADAARGQALFRVKGCASCHTHQAVAGGRTFGYNAGPDLSRYRSDSDHLRRWLHDPQAVKPNTAMPNLNLSDDEITALIAFLNKGT